MLVFRVTALFQSLRKEHQATPNTGKRTLETPVCDLQSKHDFFPLFFFFLSKDEGNQGKEVKKKNHTYKSTYGYNPDVGARGEKLQKKREGS